MLLYPLSYRVPWDGWLIKQPMADQYFVNFPTVSANGRRGFSPGRRGESVLDIQRKLSSYLGVDVSFFSRKLFSQKKFTKKVTRNWIFSKGAFLKPSLTGKYTSTFSREEKNQKLFCHKIYFWGRFIFGCMYTFHLNILNAYFIIIRFDL